MKKYIRELVSLKQQLALLLPARTPTRSRSLKARPERNDDVLHEQWCIIRRHFFPDLHELDTYTVRWAPRPQKRVLASCNIHRRRILVAQELSDASTSQWLEPILYHEMCHAVIGHGVALSSSGKRQWHGKEFKELEARHPKIKALDHWIKSGGWAKAVRSHRSKVAWRTRKQRAPIHR